MNAREIRLLTASYHPSLPLSMTTARGLKRTLLTLAATPNGAAVDALVAALGSSEASARVGAARTLAARVDAVSHERLLVAAADCRADVRRALAERDVKPRLRPAAIKAITGHDVGLCRKACRHAVDAEDHRLLSTVVDAALDPKHPFAVGLASAALQLARSLSAAIEAKRLGQKVAEDPAFARRPALESLGRAVQRFGENQRLELLDAWLMITTYNNPILRSVVKDESHAAHRPVLDALRTNQGLGAMDVLIHALEDDAALPALHGIATERDDRPFVERLLGHAGPRPGVRLVQSVRDLKGFPWAADGKRDRLLGFDDARQAAAVRLQAATDAGRDSRVEMAALMFEGGADAGRVAACESLRRVKDPRVESLLTKALDDDCPSVVAAAAEQLRRHGYPNALERLVALLEHPAEEVVVAAQHTLGEFTLENYKAVADKLPTEKRVAVGRLVGRADPEAIAAMTADLKAPMPNRRREALRLISEMGLVDRVLSEVTDAVTDGDPAVRAEAATVLGDSQSQAAIHALTEAMHDRYAGVRKAAEASLRRLDSLSVADSLLASIDEGSPTGEEA